MEERSALPLPLFKSPTGDRFKFAAHFNGSHIIAEDRIAILNLHANGTFGKVVPSKRKSKRRNVSLSDDDSDHDQEEDKRKPLYERKHLFLLLEEAFFLLQLDCLRLTDQNAQVLDLRRAWKLFNETSKLFLQNYIVYHYYKSRNWVVKVGLQFGGDFLLYKESPEVCHSMYLVIVTVSQELGGLDLGDKFKTRRSMSTNCLLGINRLTEAAGKEVLIVKICLPGDQQMTTEDLGDPACIKRFGVQEVVFKRMQGK